MKKTKKEYALVCKWNDGKEDIVMLTDNSEETKLMRSLLWAMVNLGQKEEALKILAEFGVTPEEAIFGKNSMKGKKQTESEAKE